MIGREFGNKYVDQQLYKYEDTAYGQHKLGCTISVIIGNGVQGYSGDDGKAVNSQLSKPYGVTMDGTGNIYIADTNNHCIRKVHMPLAAAIINNHKDTFIDKKLISIGNIPDGTVAYYTLDGSEPQLESHMFTKPFYISQTTTIKVKVFDFRKGLWSSTTSTTYKKLNDDGIIVTIAGSGTAGYFGDGRKAVQSRLNSPKSLAVDSAGNVFIADTNNHCIRKIDLNGRIFTIAGMGKAGYSGDGWIATMARLHYPNYLTIDSNGNLYISDSFNNCIRKVDNRGIITTVAGCRFAGYSGDGGPAVYARLRWPNGIVADKQGSIYIADTLNHCIRKVDPKGVISTIAGNGKAGYKGDGNFAALSQLHCPQGIDIDNEGNLYICDNNNNRIRKIAQNGRILTVAGTGRVGYSKTILPALNADMNMPYDLTVDPTGNFIIADTYNNCIRKVRLPES